MGVCVHTHTHTEQELFAKQYVDATQIRIARRLQIRLAQCGHKREMWWVGGFLIYNIYVQRAREVITRQITIMVVITILIFSRSFAASQNIYDASAHIRSVRAACIILGGCCLAAGWVMQHIYLHVLAIECSLYVCVYVFIYGFGVQAWRLWCAIFQYTLCRALRTSSNVGTEPTKMSTCALWWSICMRNCLCLLLSAAACNSNIGDDYARERA